MASLVQWQGKVLSESVDMSIRVWDVGTGAHDAMLASDNAVYGLAVHGDRLYCVSSDGTIWMWPWGRGRCYGLWRRSDKRRGILSSLL